MINSGYVFDGRTMAHGPQPKAAHYVFPQAEARFDLGNGAFIPFAELRGDLERNDMRSLHEQNLYLIYSNYPLRSTAEYGLRIGVTGRIFEERMGYKLSFSYGIRTDHNAWVLKPHFDVTQGRLNTMSVRGDASFRVLKSLYLEVGAGVSSYTWSEEAAHGLPEFRGDFAARYRHEKFAVGLKLDLQSRRDLSLYDNARQGYLDYRIPFTAELGVQFDWFIDEYFTVFAQGINLTNQRIYDWSRPIPAFGAGCMVGLKVNFNGYLIPVV